LLRILSTANKNTKLGEVTRLFVEREKLRGQMKLLRERSKKNAEAIKEVTTPKNPEQFLFKF
jgi:hypothetical protein